MAITGTQLRHLPDQPFANLLKLKSLDLRNNTFAEIKVAALNTPSLHHAYLSGAIRDTFRLSVTLTFIILKYNASLRIKGNPLECTESTRWILDQEKGSFGDKIADKDNLRCTAPYEGRPLVQVVEIINVNGNCRYYLLVDNNVDFQVTGGSMSFEFTVSDAER